jgi:hypothetical protein
VCERHTHKKRHGVFEISIFASKEQTLSSQALDKEPSKLGRMEACACRKMYVCTWIVDILDAEEAARLVCGLLAPRLVNGMENRLHTAWVCLIISRQRACKLLSTKTSPLWPQKVQ